MGKNNGRCGCGRHLGVGEFACSFCSRDMFWENPIPVDRYINQDPEAMDKAWQDLIALMEDE